MYSSSRQYSVYSSHNYVRFDFNKVNFFDTIQTIKFVINNNNSRKNNNLKRIYILYTFLIYSLSSLILLFLEKHVALKVFDIKIKS